MHGGVEVFLTSAVNEGGWPASHPGHFALREQATSTHWIGGCGEKKNPLVLALNRAPVPWPSSLYPGTVPFDYSSS
jgi:hypothetical protein